MKPNYEEIEPPAELLQKVINRIEKEERLLVLKKRVFGFFVGLIGLMTALIYSFNLAQATILESGFNQYFSLLFSDTAIIVNYWQSFFMTILESFPAAEIAFFLIALSGVLQVVKILIKDLKNIINLQTVYGFK